jgi:hypothetical protein
VFPIFLCSAATDKNANKKVAIKKVTNAFADLVDAKRILREMKLLRHFNHENVRVRLVKSVPILSCITP